MKISQLYRRVVTICAVAVMLAGCGGTQPPIGTTGALNLHGKKQSQTFSFTGRKQMFAVPTGVTRVKVTASGASGAGFYSGGGSGGLITAVVRVTPGESLAVFVGGEGTYYGGGGYNGGGSSGTGINGIDGGGASDVRQGGSKLEDRVVVAGGGAGQGCCAYSDGGAGGGRTGATGSGGSGSGSAGGGGGGFGGDQKTGGSGGAGAQGSYPGSRGGRGTFGDGGHGGEGGSGGSEGGGGGGGYYGGGGGGGGSSVNTTSGSNSGSGGGGGGGSSYVEKSATHVTDKAGAAARGNGRVIISWH